MCPKALAELGLSEIPISQATETFPIRLKRMKNHYATACKIRVVGKNLERTTLEQSAKYLLEIIDYAARFKMKKRLHCNYTGNEILSTMGAYFLCLRKWLASIGDTKNVDRLACIEDVIKAGRSGDQHILQMFGLDDVGHFYLDIIKKLPPKTSLAASYTRAKVNSAAALKIGDVFLEKVSSCTMLYLDWMATEAYKTREVGFPISPEDVCDTIIHEVSEITDLLEASELPIRTWSMKRHGRIADETEASLENEDDDESSYHPSTEESDRDSSNDSNSLPDRAQIAPSHAESTSSLKSGKRAGLGKRKRKSASDKSQTTAISQGVSSADVTSQPSPKRPKQSDAADQQQEAQPERSSTASPIGNQTPKAMASKTGKRQHHAKRPCPVCGKDEGNLKCHLKSHVKKGLIEENQVDKLLAVAIHQCKTRGPGRASQNKTKKGLKLKWCPVDDCSAVTHFLRSHLTHFHQMKPGELLNNHLRVARHYQGSTEVTAVQDMIRAMRSQVATSTTTTNTSTTNPSASTKSPSEFTTNPSASISSTPTSITDLPASDPSGKNESESDSNGENLDPDFEADDDLNAYFEDPNPSNDRQKWLIGFYRYLNTPDCGRKRNKNRRQHARQVQKILEDLDSGGGDINILSEDEGYIVWTEWVDPKMEDLSSGTIRSYLGTYQMFLNYVTMERVRAGQVPDLPSDVLLILRATIPKLKGWRKTVHLEMRPQRNQKCLDECDYRLTTLDVDLSQLSGVMQNASLMLEPSKHQTFLMQELCLVRDMIIAELTIQTSTRRGALAFAELQHFHTMRVDPSTSMRVMLIPDHKRGIAGPAPVTLSQDMYVKMQTYVSHILPQFGSSRDSNLFLTVEGKRFAGGTICRRLPEIWKRSGVRSDLRVTATNIRKWIVTVCHQKKTEGAQVDESALRLAMCHSDRTAQTFYLREDMTEVAARATLTISQCTREAPIPSQRPSNTSSATTAQPQVDLQPVPQSDDSAPFSSAQPVTQPDVTAVQVTSESEPTRPDVTAVQVTSESELTRPDVTAVQVTSVSEPKRPLTQGEKAEISKIFVEVISSNKKITFPGI